MSSSRRVLSSLSRASPSFHCAARARSLLTCTASVRRWDTLPDLSLVPSASTTPYRWARHFSTTTPPPERKTLRQEIDEYTALGSQPNMYDKRLIRANDALAFPRIKTTSISTKRVVVADKCARHGATLVLVAFRNFADGQLDGWKRAADAAGVRWYDVTVNESFAAQAFSGFVQRWQRSATPAPLHDFHVAFNSKARQPLEDLLITTNRMFGNVLLLDRQGRVRFRAAGHPDDDALNVFHQCAKSVFKEDAARLRPDSEGDTNATQ